MKKSGSEPWEWLVAPAHHKTAPPKGCAMTDEKKDGKEAKNVEDEQLKDLAGGGGYSKTNSRGQTYYLHSKKGDRRVDGHCEGDDTDSADG